MFLLHLSVCERGMCAVVHRWRLEDDLWSCFSVCGPENQTLLITCGDKHLYPNESSHQASFSLFLFVFKSFKNVSGHVFLFHIFANILIWEARVRF